MSTATSPGAEGSFAQRSAAADAQLLDAAFLPAAAGIEPSLVLFGATDLTPGAWRRAEHALGIPESARRLTLPIGDAEMPHFVATRALDLADAVPFLIGLRDLPVRPSVRAWQIAAHVTRRIIEGELPAPSPSEPGVATLTQLRTLSRAMPAATVALLVEIATGDDDLLSAPVRSAQGPELGRMSQEDALLSFVQSAQRAYVAAEAASRHAGAGRGRRESAQMRGLTLTLSTPPPAEQGWPLDVLVSVPRATNREEVVAHATQVLLNAGAEFAPLGRATPQPQSEAASAAAAMSLSEPEVELLLRAAPVLETLGATVELPPELVGGVARNIEAHLRFTGPAPQQPQLGLGELVRYDLDIALGGEKVDAETLRKLAREARQLVRIGSSWLALDDTARSELERLARAADSTGASMSRGQALAATLGGSADLAGISASVREVNDAWLRSTLEQLRDAGRFAPVDASAAFTGDLRPYQQTGLNWLAGMHELGLGACLADDMGLGKTVQVISLFTHLQQSTEKLRALVVCPTSLIGNWERELTRFSPTLDVHVHHGPTRESRASALRDHEIVVTSYGLIARDRRMLEELEFDLVVFDEAQAVKNPDTEQARAARRVNAATRIALTGTPMENRLLELWSILDLLNPGLLGTATAFSRRYAAPIEGRGDEQVARRLRAITRPFMLRRVKSDPAIVPDLPEKQEHEVVCTLTPEQAALYQATVDSALAEVSTREGIGRRGAVLALLTRLKQICNHPLQATRGQGEIAGRSGKLDRLQMMLEEVVAEGDRALVFTQYAQMGSLLANHLPDSLGVEVLYLHGGVPRKDRDAIIQRFQTAGGEPVVFVLSLKTGGLGLNLMQASHVFHYDRWWNPAVEDQATDRTHRIGQTRQIQVHKLVCAGTLEEKIGAIIERKRTLAGRIIEVSGGGEGWVTELTDAELHELVSLSGTPGAGRSSDTDTPIAAEAGETPEES